LMIVEQLKERALMYKWNSFVNYNASASKDRYFLLNNQTRIIKFSNLYFCIGNYFYTFSLRF
jgi:hypothetical protein